MTDPRIAEIEARLAQILDSRSCPGSLLDWAETDARPDMRYLLDRVATLKAALLYVTEQNHLSNHYYVKTEWRSCGQPSCLQASAALAAAPDAEDTTSSLPPPRRP